VQIDIKTLVLLVVVGTISGLVTYQVGKGEMHDIKVEYENKVLKIKDEAEQFIDNFSLVLTYIDTARSDLEKGIYYLNLANFSIEQKSYNKAMDSANKSVFCFTLSQENFLKALQALSNMSQKTDLINLYINYTQVALLLTEVGIRLSENISMVAMYLMQNLSEQGNSTLSNCVVLNSTFQDREYILDNCLTEIKNYHKVR